METGANKLPVNIISIRGTFLFLFSLSFLLSSRFLPKLIRSPCRSSPFAATRVHAVHCAQTGLRFVKARRSVLLEPPPSFAANRKRNLTCVAPLRVEENDGERERDGSGEVKGEGGMRQVVEGAAKERRRSGGGSSPAASRGNFASNALGTIG